MVAQFELGLSAERRLGTASGDRADPRPIQPDLTSIAGGENWRARRTPTAIVKFWRIGGGFFRGRARRIAIGFSLVLVALGVAQIGVQILLNFWSGAVFDAIERRDSAELLRQVATVSVLAVAFLVFSGYHMYAKMRLQVEWRIWITERLVVDWLAHGRVAQLAEMGEDNDNPDQRIAEDARLATEAAVDLADGIFNAVLILACFGGILWDLSGVLRVEPAPGYAMDIPGYLLFAALLYAAAGSWLTYVMGRPLIRLNRDRLGQEADFRIGLIRAGADSTTASPRVAGPLRREIRTSFARLVETWRLVTLRTRRLTYMTSGYAVIATGFPVLIATPHYFAEQITLGGLMQSVAAFVTVQATLSWFVNNYVRFADWSASVDRISTFRTAIDALMREAVHE